MMPKFPWVSACVIKLDKLYPRRRNWKLTAAVQTVFIYIWLSTLGKTDSCISVYVLCAFIGSFCVLDNSRRGTTVPLKRGLVVGISAGLFSTATLLANYSLFQPFYDPVIRLTAGASFIGGFFLGWNVLICAMERLPVSKCPVGDRAEQPWKVFAVSFVIVAGVYLLHLFCVAYPGYLSSDSFASMIQIRDGEYVNNHPFWYTMLIRVLMGLGYTLFGSSNAAVATYTVFQCLLMAAGIAYVLVTLYQAGLPRWSMAVVLGAYTLLPYHVVYSATVWKDVLFSVSLLVLLTALYRLLLEIGGSKLLNYFAFTFGAVGFCLLRTNGWYVFLVTSVLLLFLLGRQYRMLKILCCMILFGCWVLLNPVLEALHVGSTDFIEALSLPLQQIAKYVREEGYMDVYEKEFLEMAVDLDAMAENYLPYLADPVKFRAVRRENLSYIRENLLGYAQLWRQFGARRPDIYLEAWVDLTKGYWNGGYDYWVFWSWVDPNEFGVVQTGCGGGAMTIFARLLVYLQRPEFFKPLYSIGLHVWMLAACCIINALKKRKEALLTIPILVLIVGLWLGTPVFAEFRYAYPMFLALPLLAVTCYHQTEQANHLERREKCDEAQAANEP